MARRVRGWTVCVLLSALVLTACGGDGGDATASEQPSAPAASQSEVSDASEATAGDDGGDAATGAETYVVRSGDTLSAIAKRFDTTVARIARANDLADPDVLDIGQELTIPGR